MPEMAKQAQPWEFGRAHARVAKVAQDIFPEYEFGIEEDQPEDYLVMRFCMSMMDVLTMSSACPEGYRNIPFDHLEDLSVAYAVRKVIRMEDEWTRKGLL